MTGDLKHDLKEKGNKTAKKMYKLAFVCAVLVLLIAFILTSGEDGFSETWLYAGVGIFVWLILMSIINWRKAKSGNCVKKVEKYCAQTPNPEATMARLEQTWRDGGNIGIGKIDPAYIIAVRDYNVKIISLEGVTGVGKHDGMTTFQGGGARGNIRTYSVVFMYKDGKSKSLNLDMNANAADLIINYISQNCPEIVIGE